MAFLCALFTHFISGNKAFLIFFCARCLLVDGEYFPLNK